MCDSAAVAVQASNVLLLTLSDAATIREVVLSDDVRPLLKGRTVGREDADTCTARVQIHAPGLAAGTCTENPAERAPWCSHSARVRCACDGPFRWVQVLMMSTIGENLYCSNAREGCRLAAHWP